MTKYLFGNLANTAPKKTVWGLVSRLLDALGKLIESILPGPSPSEKEEGGDAYQS